MQINKDLPEVMQVLDLLTDHRQNRNVVDVVKAQNTTNSSAQQKIALARNATKEATLPHAVFQRMFHF